MKKDEWLIKVRTAGYAEPGSDDSYLSARVGRSSCGHIKDGIAFSFGNHGCWVVAHKDLQKIANKAALYRRCIRKK